MKQNKKKNDQPVMFGHVAVCHRSLSLSFFFYTTDQVMLDDYLPGLGQVIIIIWVRWSCTVLYNVCTYMYSIQVGINSEGRYLVSLPRCIFGYGVLVLFPCPTAFSVINELSLRWVYTPYISYSFSPRRLFYMKYSHFLKNRVIPDQTCIMNSPTIL